MGIFPNDSAMETAKVGSTLQMIALFSGILPLFMPILWLVWVSQSVVIAIAAQEEKSFLRDMAYSLLQQIVLTGLVLSGVLHAAFASGNPLAIALQGIVTLGLMRRLFLGGVRDSREAIHTIRANHPANRKFE